MKTSKFIMIASVLAITMASFSFTSTANAEPPVIAQKVIDITFEKAMENSGLVTAMHMQLGREFLNTDQQIFVADVSYLGFIFRISGTYGQWHWFFRTGWKTQPKDVIKVPTH